MDNLVAILQIIAFLLLAPFVIAFVVLMPAYAKWSYDDKHKIKPSAFRTKIEKALGRSDEFAEKIGGIIIVLFAIVGILQFF